ncbi:MAG: efflux RND transporter periplasmic adaptor subunit [Rhodobacter sp.]|nr:efflux RND transporter periplasmic adaptor subunit [Rhodobacter sp.]
MREAETPVWSRLWALGLGSVQVAAVAGVVGGTVFVSNHMRENKSERVQIETRTFTPSVQTDIVQVRTRSITLEKTGSVEPSVYVNITPEVSGLVESVRRGLGGGAVFEAGEVLFRIAREDLEIELRRREADLAAAIANLDIERAQADNARREWQSFGRGEITDLAARRPQVRSAEAQVLTAEASLDAAELNLARAGFALPFDGTIVDLSLAQGQKLTAGQSYGRAYGFASIEVTVSLSPDELSLLDEVVGLEAVIDARVLGKPVSLYGAVSRVSGEVDRATRLSTLIITLDAAEVRDLGLQPGTFVTVTLAGPHIADMAEVPNAALQEGDQLWLVEDDVLRRTKDVEVILRGRHTTLVTGLEHGARIAVGTIAGATNGMRIRAELMPTAAEGDLALRYGAPK